MTIDDATRDELMKHPEVQQAMLDAGEDALKNPAVQQALMQATKEKFPHLIEAAPAKIAEWANDPELRQKAYSVISTVGTTTLHAVVEAPREVYALLQQGPAGLRVLAFIGGCASIALAIFQARKISKMVGKPMEYLIDVYQIIFAATTIMFEAKPQWLECIKSLDRYHDLLCEYCKFLCTVFGRGMFYLFQASLWLSEMNVSGKSLIDWIEVLVGAWMAFIGMLHVLMHWGIMPQQVAEKSKEIAMKATEIAQEAARASYMSVQNMRDSLLSNQGKGEIELGPPAFSNKSETGRDL